MSWKDYIPDNISKIMYVQDESTAEKKSETTEVKKKPVTPTSITSKVGIQTAAATPVTTGTDYNKTLDDVCEAAHDDTADFWAFHKTISKMDGKPISEDQKYELGYAAFQAQDVAPKELVDSASHYIGLLDKEASQFNTDLSGAEQVQIIQKKAHVDMLIQQNAEMSKQMQDNLQEIERVNGEILNSTNTLNSEKSSFEYHFNNKKAVFADRIAKIKQYLYATPTTK